MNSASKDKVPTVFRIRLQKSLSKRVGNDTGLTRKQLAYAVGAHGKTLDLWMSGRGSPTAELFAELCAFFDRNGDRLFKYEVLNIEPPPMVPAPVLAALRAYERALEAA